MRTDVYYRKDASPSAGRLADFCRNLTPGLVLIDGNERVPMFEFGFEIAARMVECESANRIEVWSWQSFLRLCGTWLTGDTLKQNHRWVIQGESLGGTRIEAWLEEPLKPRMEVEDPEWLQNGCRADWSSILDSGNDVVLLDFKDRLGFKAMKELNAAAKAFKKTILACADLKDAQGKSHSIYSYAELAMRIGIEHGIDFSKYAETVALLEPAESDFWKSKFIRVCADDRCPFEVKLENRDPSEERFAEECLNMTRN